MYVCRGCPGLQLESNNLENISAIYTTLALLFVELASDETVCDMLQLVLSYVSPTTLATLDGT